jgi:hypothetical protein
MLLVQLQRKHTPYGYAHVRASPADRKMLHDGMQMQLKTTVLEA